MKLRIVFIIYVLFIGFVTASAQQKGASRAELEKRRASLLNEINATQKLLQSTEKDRKATVSELRAKNAQLNARQQLINNINSEITHLDRSIGDISKEIEILNQNLEVFKMRYAQSVRYAYKNRSSQNMVAFLFSSRNFNDGLRRVHYLKRYRDYRKDQAADIRKTQQSLSDKIASLNNNKAEKGSLLGTEEAQKQKIQEESAHIQQLVQELQGREKELLLQIQKDRQTAQRLQNAIQAEIQKEIEIARKKAEEEAARRRAEEEAKRKAEEAAARKKAEEEARRLAAEQERKRQEQDGGQYGDVTLNVGDDKQTPDEPTATTPATSPSAGTSTSTSTTSTSTTSTSTAKPSYKLSLTPEIATISENFTANKGRLPWPVSSGFISGKYGRNPHPVYPTVMVENNGIDITTANNASVQAVSGGTVIRVMNIDGYVVMVNHGEYFTIYSNLSSAAVQVGQKIEFKQHIGTAGKNSEGVPMMNFQIWKVGTNNSSQTLNPEHWIAPR